ncbi:MAG: hypothetical protein GXP55_19035 [Deltaproteobacteria bacterium]|nr:hypothetical protein [Deltaproteobacteria bacterium]
MIEPTSVETFLEEYFEKQPLLLKRNSPEHFRDLLTLEVVDRVITTMQLEYPQIEATSARRDDLRTEDYTYPSGLIDVVRLYKEFEDGATIILPQLHNHVPSLAHLCRSMERELSYRFQTNIYMTPGGESQGFRTHYDNHDVFVLQVAGVKQWKVYGTPVELPYRGQGFDPADGHEVGDVSMEFELEPGDMLYIPRGVMHDAYTTDGLSLHITLGVLTPSWTDLLVEGIARVGLADPEFRRSLPPGFAHEGFDRARAREIFVGLMKKVAQSADFDVLLDHFAEDLLSTRHPLLEGQMIQVARSHELSVDSRVGCRPDLLYRVRVGEETLALTVYGNEISLPAHAEQALRFALDTAEYRVAEIAGDLDDAGKLVLVRRLVREGLVEIFD